MKGVYQKRPIRNLFEKADGRWSIDITFKKPEGGYKRIRQDFPTKSEACDHLNLLRARKAARKLGLERPELNGGETLFKDFAEKFISTYSIHKRKKTRISHRTCLNSLLRSELFQEKKLIDITPETISDYMAVRGAEKMVSANRELMFLKLLFRKAVEWGKLGRNPAACQRKFDEPEAKIRPLADGEAKRLILAAAPHLKPILTVLLSTGMRKTEVLKLRWAYEGWDADGANGNSIVDLDGRRIFIPGNLAKNHRDREIPLSAELLSLFKDMREKSRGELVFNVKEIRKSFKTAVKAARIKRPVRIHDLRHTAASRMIEAGVDIVSVSELLGHSDLKITLRYCHSSTKTKKEAVEKLSQIYMPAVKKAKAGTSTRQNMTIVQIPKPVSYRQTYN